MRAWTFWHRFQPGTNGRAWMHRILVNTFINGYRRRRREREILGEIKRDTSVDHGWDRTLKRVPGEGLGDEVTAALDPETVKEVLVTIQELAEDGMTCILVTHEMGFARELANHIYFTDRGVIVEHGPPASFFAEAKDPRTQEFLSQIL